MFASASRASLAARTTELLDRFEQAWQSHPPAGLDDYVPPADDPNRQAALVHLIHIDLEYRWKGEGALPLEDYLARFPELADPAIVIELAAWEYRLRRRREPNLAIDEYLQRFP